MFELMDVELQIGRSSHVAVALDEFPTAVCTAPTEPPTEEPEPEETTAEEGDDGGDGGDGGASTMALTVPLFISLAFMALH